MADYIERSDRRNSIILMPVGPKSSLDNLCDTIASICCYAAPNTVLVLMDDTRDGLTRADLPNGLPISICRADQGAASYSVRGRLYMNLSKAIRSVLEHYDFDILLRMDDDALLIGAGAEGDAAMAFASDPSIGSLGSFRRTCRGDKRDFRPAARRLALECSIWGMATAPKLARRLRQFRRLARANGYEAGEHSLGAGCFYSRNALVGMSDLNLLGSADLLHTKMCDDQLFGLLVKAAGFRSDDFAGDGQPLGLAWQGLPASPTTLVQMGKKIVHSVKSHNGIDENDTRAEFARLRGDRHPAQALQTNAIG